VTEDRDRRLPERLDVPVARVGGSDGGADRRARRTALAVVVMALVVVALALPGAIADDAPRGSPRSSTVAVATPGPSPTARPSPALPRPSTTVTAAPIPSIASGPIPDAPRMAFYRRSNEDIEILTWTAGDATLEPEASIAGAFAGIGQEEPFSVTASPDGRSVLVQSFGSFDTRDPSPIVLASIEGGRIWTAATSAPGAAVWSADSRWLILGAGYPWTIIDTATSPPVVREVGPGGFEPDVSAAPTSGTPAPTVFGIGEPRPSGVSGDGRWVYGEVDGPVGVEGSPVRVALEGGTVEIIDEIPRTGPEAPVGGGTNAVVDPLSGRSVDAVVAFEADSVIRVREPDGSIAFQVEAEHTILGVAWVGDGRLAVVDGGVFDDPTDLRVYLVRSDGTSEPPLFALDMVASAGLVAHRDGYMVVVLAVQPGQTALLVMIRPQDGRTATLRLSDADVRDIVTVGWLARPAGG
jgi:hypothetical protein